MNAYLKPISIRKGVFSSEKSVVLEDFEGDKTSGFFENNHIINGKLGVTICQEESDLALIHLPGRTIEIPGDKGYLTVKKTQLEYVS